MLAHEYFKEAFTFENKVQILQYLKDRADEVNTFLNNLGYWACEWKHQYVLHIFALLCCALEKWRVGINALNPLALSESLKRGSRVPFQLFPTDPKLSNHHWSKPLT